MSEPHLFISRTTESTKEQQFLRTEQIETVLRHYYPDHGSSLPEYLQEGIPEVQESYSMSYQTSTSTNGHGDEDASSNNSQSSVPVDNASLISRSTAQTKTQQHKTVTKIIKTREVVHHMAPPHTDGKLINFIPPQNSDFMPYNPTNVPHDREYTYDPGPPSPAGQTPTQVYQHDYMTYGHSTSPSAVRNFYSPQTQQYGYDYPESHSLTTHTPSGSSDSPNRAMPQAPRAVASDYNHEGAPCNYEDIQGAGVCVPPRDIYRTPSPTESATYGVYGCSRGGPVVPATVEATPLSPGYQYNPGLPEGYLDRRPSYDAETLSRTPKGSLENTTYGRTGAPRTVFEEHPLPPSSADRNHHPSVVSPCVHEHYEKAPLTHTHTDSEADGRIETFRDPSLLEVIEFLGHPSTIIKANAAAYLWHLAYMDDLTKSKARSLGAIPALIQLLNQDIPETIHRNSCGALRNLSYGRKNDENKRAIRAADGIPALVRLLRKTADNEIKELVTSILWNLSSCEDLKHQIIDDALNVLVNHVIIPHSGYQPSRNPLDPIEEIKPERVMDMYCTTVFRNSSGVLRNVSSAGLYARKKLRECEGLIEALVFLIRSVVSKSDMDNKSLENVVCVLRNLSYRIEEVENPNYDKEKPQKTAARASAPIRAVSDLGCFGANRKKKDLLTTEREVPLTKNPISSSDPVRGAALLYSFEVASCYLSLLVESSNPDILEASAGALMNLAACSFQPSIDIRAFIRKQKALPILVELLRMSNDRVVCASARALRNMTIDARNRDLIGSYALKDLVLKLPNGSREHDCEISDDTCSAVLATLNEVVGKESDFARSLLSIGGIDRLVQITHKKDSYSPRVHKFASQLLYNMWQHLELREAFRKAGYKESHFVNKTMTRNSLSSPTGANTTLNRTVSSKGGTKYEDHRTLPHGTDLNSSAAPIPYSRSEGELPLSELGHSAEPPPPSQVHRPHMGVFPSGMQQTRSPTEPVYAQVNREKKKGRARHSDIPVQLLSSEQPEDVPAGDSWV